MVTLAIDYTAMDYLLVALLGIVAGCFGGLLGIGGSAVLIPGLTFLFGRDQHVWQATAMICNVVISVPAAIRHYRAGAVNFGVLRWLLPAALLFMIFGVWLSNQPVFASADGGIWLGRMLALFLCYVVYANIQRLGPKSPDHEPEEPQITRTRAFSIGGAMGAFAGLVGGGGGALAVPLQQVIMKMPLRACIATSSAAICVSGVLGAVYKTGSLGQHHNAQGEPYNWLAAVVLAGLLTPTAIAGGYIGAALTHTLPLKWVRIAFIGLMLLAIWKMAAIGA